MNTAKKHKKKVKPSISSFDQSLIRLGTHLFNAQTKQKKKELVINK